MSSAGLAAAVERGACLLRAAGEGRWNPGKEEQYGDLGCVAGGERLRVA